MKQRIDKEDLSTRASNLGLGTAPENCHVGGLPLLEQLLATGEALHLGMAIKLGYKGS